MSWLKLLRKRILLIPLVLTVLLAASGGVYVKAHGVLSPGRLSAAQGEELGGFSSHAMFEQECKHCHGPIHCVIPDNCQDCHLEIARERMEATGLHGKLPAGQECGACHQEHRGHDASIVSMPLPNIDHGALTGFDLALHTVDYDGNPIVCESCHTTGRYSAEAVDCVACHEAVDQDFMGAHMNDSGHACTDCHDGLGAYRSFDHATIFPLDGEHADLSCQECHQGGVYAQTESACSTCHDAYVWHADQFGQQCQRCHTTTAWLPALLREHRFARDHGSVAGETVACETCHTESYTAYRCDTCHEHDKDLVADQHVSVDASDAASCVDCHPTGAPGDYAQHDSVIGR